jgi:hypothetical protein
MKKIVQGDKMKNILLVIIMLMVATQCSAFYVEEKVGDTVLCSYDVEKLTDMNDAIGRDVYVDGVLQLLYTPQALIQWAMDEYPQLVGTAHESALTAFAIGPVGMKDLLIGRGAIIDMANGGTTFSDLAQAIIVKARELGAKGLD